MSANHERPYQVCLYVGPSAPTLAGVRVVDLTPPAATPIDVISTLSGADLSPADLRSRVLFVADGGAEHLPAALMVYSALLGFAKRRLDVAFALDGEALAMDELDASVRALPVPPKPADPIESVQVGGAARTDMAHLDLSAGLGAATAVVVRYARRLRFVPPPAAALAIPQLVALAGLRARGPVDKLPLLCDGTEPAPGDGPVPDAVGVDLDALRRAGEDVRRGQRSDDRAALASVLNENPYARLAEADAVPVEDVLHRLGAHSKVVDLPARPGTPEYEAGQSVPTEVWHCTRPERHTNGDANPSARITVKNGAALFQCFRCDPERVGPLRLVMDTMALTGDEAADWILSA